MKIIVFLALLLIGNCSSQDVVQVVCSHNAITARIQKEVIETASYTMENVHLNDKECAFDTEEGDFYVRTISPLTSCGTHFETNDTHVVFTNSISTVETGHLFPYGVVVGSQTNNHVLSALISCTYRIDLNVSTMFIPNISIVVIQMPDAYGAGEFEATMNIFTDSTYREPYIDPPILNPDETIYVGVNLVGESSNDVYLLVEECWGTISDDASAIPRYPLIQDRCPVLSSADGLVRVTQNGISQQAMWNSPVFKFVGEGEEFDNVWLHCNLQLCINRRCEPTCPAKRKRRSINDGGRFGLDDIDAIHTISLGPLRRLRITEISKNDTKTIYVETEDFPPEIWSNDRLKHQGAPQEDKKQQATPIWNNTSIAVVAAIGGLAMLCLMLGIVAVIVRSRNNSGSGVEFGGMENKAFA